MFCDSKNDPDETRPNVNVCPVCMAHPGTLPVINKEAVRHMVRIGLAVGGSIPSFSEFDRKSYFYPDIPKGYQISQYKFPLVAGGSINGVPLTRIHLEEDTARSTHDTEGGSLIDFNRAGVPLMELVTEPVIHSADEAVAFARELQLLLRALGASDANMEKGEMRVEANVSVSTTSAFGTKVEVKNLNSFRAVERAIAAEIERQSALLEQGGRVLQETRGWNEARGETFAQRQKEESHDYRYFPDPDLPKLALAELPEFDHEMLRKTLPELPWERRRRYLDAWNLKEEDANLLVADEELQQVFEDTVANAGGKEVILLAANYLTNDIAALRGAEGGTIRNITGQSLIELAELLTTKRMSSRNAKDIISILYREGGSAKEISESRGLLTDTSINLDDIARRLIAEHEKAAAEVRAGKAGAVEYLVGQGMRLTRGGIDPGELRQRLLKSLEP